MKKRMLAMMMAIVMVMTLLPTSALAAGGVGEPSETNSGAVFSKTVHQENNGDVKITLEAWATGQTVETTKQQPLDIVLVLDQSGSMADRFDKKTSRQAAMKNAVNGFIDKVAEEYTADAAHRISIVTFGSEAKVSQDWTAVDATGTNALKNKVSGLPTIPEGATNVAAGMTRAQTQLSNAQKDHKKVVVVFTDGVPTKSNEFNVTVATNAIATAKALKAVQTEIYTIGIFGGADPDQLYGASGFEKNSNGTVGSYWANSSFWGIGDIDACDVPAGNRFLNYLSTNYTNTDNIGLKRYDKRVIGIGDLGWEITQIFDRSSSDYYLTATDSESLNKVFTKISEKINSAVNEQLNTKAVVKDTMTDYFKLPANTDDIKVYTQKRKADGSWDAPAEAIGTTVNINGQTVTVTDYDYAKNFVSEKAKSDGSYGQKLVIEFTITPDLTKLAQAEQVKVATNTGAGLYLDETAVATGKSGEASFCGVKYDANGGTGTVPATEIGANGKKFDVPKTCDGLRREKAVLLGFSAEKKDLVTSENDATGVVTECNPANGMLATLYAVWAEDKNGDGTPDYKEKKYTITYAAGTEDTVNNMPMPAKVDNVLAGTEQTVSTVKPTREGYTFSKWQGPEDLTVTDNKFFMPDKDVTFTAQWTPNDVTITFDANGGAWAVDVAGYTMNADKTTASKKFKLSDTVEKITPDPANGTKKFVGWGISADATEPLSLWVLSPKAAKLKELTKETGILYAIWEDAAQPTEKLNYTIHQHYIGSNGKQDAQFNDELPKTASAGTKISDLIPAELQKDREYYYQTYIYLSSETKIVNDNVATPVADDTVLNKDNTQIHLYYYLDAWNDKDDTLTGGDDIPDKYQAVVTYKVVGGTWKDGKTDDQVQVFTLKTKNKETGVWEDVTPAPTLGNTIPTGMISSYSRTASQSWDKDITKDTKVTESVTYTYTFTKGSSGGGGGSSSTHYYISLKKVDAQDGEALSGAKFGLYLDGKQIATATSDRNGIVRFSMGSSNYRSLTDKSNLYCQELTAPEGYKLSNEKIAVSKKDVSTSSSTSDKNAKTVKNSRSKTPSMLNGEDHFAYIVGYPDKTVHPQSSITRAEVATIFFRLLTEETRTANATKTNKYADVSSDKWYNQAVSTLSAMGIIKGDSRGNFNPNAPITRAEFAAIAARFDKTENVAAASFGDVATHWAKPEISVAANNGWINGYTDGTFHPDSRITRAEAMAMINRVLQRLPESKADLLDGMIQWSDNADTSKWYYLAVQEATNSHYYELKANQHEKWTKLRENRDWTELEK